MFGFVIRFLMALALVLATWNPTEWSYAHWLMVSLPKVTAELAFTGVVLLIGWILFLNATLDALGMLGILLSAAFFGTLAWLLFDQGWLTVRNELITWAALMLIASILAIGMSWAHFWRRLSGQVEVHEDH